MEEGLASDSAVAQHWDGNADVWADQVRRGRDVYREYFNNPAFLRFIGDLSGKIVLDAGCGEGYNTRILARSEARMIGVDVSPRMIALAQEEEQREPLGIRYEVASFTDLVPFDTNSFDAVVSFMALMDGADFSIAIREIYRVLRPGGELMFSVLHPCFMTRGFAWIQDEVGKSVALRVAGYFDSTPYVEQWHFKGATESPDFAVPRFPRTLSEYLNAVTGAGLALTCVEEPYPTEEMCVQHRWLERWREHAALFLYIRARKE